VNRDERRAHAKAMRKHQHKEVMKVMPDGTEVRVCNVCGVIE
jgi:hypothetical protein